VCDSILPLSLSTDVIFLTAVAIKLSHPLKEAALTKDFVELRAQLKKEGFFDPAYGHVAFRIAELVVMHAAGFWMVLNGMVRCTRVLDRRSALTEWYWGSRLLLLA
jgi:hypothetical protein